MGSGNPVLNNRTFRAADTGAEATGAPAMTMAGTVNRTALLLVILVAAAGFIWTIFEPRDAAAMRPWMLGGGLAVAVIAAITVWKKTWAPFTTPVYAVVKGLFIGATSANLEARFPGVVLQAVMLTFAVLAVLLLIYRTGVIKVSRNFRIAVLAATGAIVLLYLVNLGMRLFGYDGIGFIHEATPLGIAFSAFAVIMASLNLVLDFDFIEKGVARGAPKYMEWFAAFGLLVTLVWLYVEILRLLTKVNKRKRR